MPTNGNPARSIPKPWTGDFEELIGHEEDLREDEEVCDLLFSSKREALSAGLFLASREQPPGNQDGMDALSFLKDVPWGDMIQNIEGVTSSLMLALDATHDGLALWTDDDAGERRFGDEFSLTPDQVAGLSTEWRMAYVASLLYSLSVFWGVDENGRHDRSIADLLHTIQQTIVGPTTFSKDSH